MAEKNIDVAYESTSQEILSKIQQTSLNVTGLLSAGSTLTCSASDDVLLTPLNTEIQTRDGQIAPSCKVNKINGTLRIVMSAKNVIGMGAGGVTVKDNNGNSYDIYVVENTTYQTAYKDIPVSHGTVLTFYTYSSNANTPYVNLITICGTLSEPTIDVPNLSLV